jgi:hypothetical protein
MARVLQEDRDNNVVSLPTEDQFTSELESYA